jgi:hypothetical protein
MVRKVRDFGPVPVRKVRDFGPDNMYILNIGVTKILYPSYNMSRGFM